MLLPILVAASSQALSISVLPDQIYTTELPGRPPLQAWIADLRVDGIQKSMELKALTTSLYAADQLVKRVESKTPGIVAVVVEGAGGKPAWSIRQQFAEPVAFKVDKAEIELMIQTAPDGKTEKLKLSYPIQAYEQKTKLYFPVRGKSIILNGFAHNGGHAHWSQVFAIDIFALGDGYSILKGSGDNNQDFLGWGKSVVAPAAGEVIYARNDVPDQTKPGSVDEGLYDKLPDPDWNLAGNVVAIDHGNGETSVIGHMQQGSVTVKKGDKVKLGQSIGRLGNSGNTNSPHVHYQLISGKVLHRCGSLPPKFVDVEGALNRGTYVTVPGFIIPTP